MEVIDESDLITLFQAIAEVFTSTGGTLQQSTN